MLRRTQNLHGVNWCWESRTTVKHVAVSQELPKLLPTYRTRHVRSLSGALHVPRQHMATCVAETRLTKAIREGRLPSLCMQYAHVLTHLQGSRDSTHYSGRLWRKIALYGRVSFGVARDVLAHSVCTTEQLFRIWSTASLRPTWRQRDLLSVAQNGRGKSVYL